MANGETIAGEIDDLASDKEAPSVDCSKLTSGRQAFVADTREIIADMKPNVRDAYQAALTQIIATQIETALKLAVCIDRNTAAMEDCTIELGRIRERE